MREFVRGFKTPNLFRVDVHQSESENDTQCDRKRDFPRHLFSIPLNARLGFENCEVGTTSSPFVSGYAASVTKQVYLYKWFLIRVVGNDPENDRVQIKLGGYTTSDLLGKEKLTTAPIESRIEKCKLRTVDGLNILMMGQIDEQCSHDNGFPLQVIHLFLFGFPFNWNHVINVYFGKPHLSRSVLSARKAEENAGQQKYEALNSKHVGQQIKGMGTGKLSFQEPRDSVSKAASRESSTECSKIGKYGMQPSVSSAGKGEDSTGQQTDEVLNSEHVGEQVESMEDYKLSFQEPEESMSKAEENMLNVTSSRVFSAKCRERGKCKTQPIRSLKQFKYNRLNAKSKPGTPSLVDSPEDSNVSRESAGCPSSVFCTESVKKDDKTPVPMFSDVETHEQTDMDDNLMVTVHDTEKDSVKGKKNVLKSVISHSIKGNRVSKNQIDSSGSLYADKLADSAQTVNIANISENQTNNHSPSAEDGAQQGLVNKETEQSPTANVLLEQLEHKCTSAGEQTLDIQIPALEVNETSCKKSKLRSKVNLSSKRNGSNVLPSLPKTILCDETTASEHVNMNFEVQHATHLTRPLHAEHSPFDPKSRLLPNEIVGPGTDEKGQCEGNCLVDVGECGFHLKEDVLSGQAAENHISNRSLKRGRYRSRSKLSDSSCEQSKECVSNQTTVMNDMMKKCNDIDSTCGSNPNSVPYEFQHDMGSKHCAETGSNCLDKSGDKEEGCLHPQRSSTENNGQTSTNKSHNTRKLLSIPPRRVKMTPQEASKAFGLKTSRSGRLIVPPLAHWCNQTVAYDLDGGIIAIFDGSSQRVDNESTSNYKPPQEEDGFKQRQKLCNAANEIIRTPSSVKRKGKD